MDSFIFDLPRLRVVFGPGRRSQLKQEVEALGLKRVLIIADPIHVGTATLLSDQLGSLSAGIYDKVAVHVPVEIAEAGKAKIKELGADGCVCLGGGSSIGLAKIIALDLGLPIIAIPTTYAGSEMTPVWGLTSGALKKTGKDAKVQPKSVIYDAELLTSLPPKIAGPSGINAMAHCVEALYAENRNPLMSTLAQEGVRAMAESLPLVCRNPKDLDAQSGALYGAWMGGIVLGSVGMALHHKLCHTLGGTFNLPHADTHAVVLPYATAYNIDAAPDAKRRLTAALGSPNVAAALHALGQAVGAPASLKAMGLTPADLDKAADLAMQNSYVNPRPLTREGIRQLLEDAYQGIVPRT